WTRRPRRRKNRRASGASPVPRRWSLGRRSARIGIPAGPWARGHARNVPVTADRWTRRGAGGFLTLGESASNFRRRVSHVRLALRFRPPAPPPRHRGGAAPAVRGP